MNMPARNFTKDKPLDARVLHGHAARLKMRVWVNPKDATQGTVFCQGCGFGGDVSVVLSRWAADPIGCFRLGDKACDGRAFK